MAPKSQTLVAMEKDPKFARFSYDTQIRLRARAAAQLWSADPAFIALPDASKERLIASYAMRPPVFENPDLVAYTQGLAKDIQAGSPAGIAIAANPAMYQQTPVYQIGMQLGNSILQATGQTEAARSGQLMYDSLYGRDGQKVKSYLRSVADKGAASQAYATVGEVLGQLGGFAANFVYLKNLPVTKAATGRALGVIANQAAGSRLRSQVVRGVLGNFAENTIESVALTANELVSQSLQGQRNVGDMGNVLRTYGRNAILDYAIGTVTGAVWPFVKLTGKALAATFLPRAGRAKAAQQLAQEQLPQLIRRAVAGELPPELEQQMPAFFADQTRARSYIGQVHEALGTTNPALNEVPFYRVNTEATMLGKQLGLGQNGEIMLRSTKELADNIDKPVVYRSALEAEDALAEQLHQLNLKAPDKYPLEDYGPLASLVQARRAADSTLDSLGKRKGFLDASKRDYLSQTEASALVGSAPNQAWLVRAPQQTGAFTGLEKALDGDHLAVVHRVAPFEEVQASMKRSATFKTETPGLRESPLELAADGLKRMGYDAAVVDEAGTIATLYPSRVRPIQEAPTASRILKAGAAETAFGQDTFVRVETEKLYKQSEVTGDPRRAARLLSGRGELSKERVGMFARELLADTGVKGRVEVKTAGEVAANWDEGGRVLRVDLPASVAPEARREVLRALTDAVKEAGVERPAAARIARVAGRQLRQLELPGSNYADQVAWARDNAVKLAGKNFQELPGGRFAIGQRVFGNLDELADHLVLTRMSPEAVRVALAEDGYRLVGRRGAYSVLDPSGKLVGRGASMQELLPALGWRPERIPSEFLPEVAVVDGGVRFNYQQNVIRGNTAELLRYLDRFENFKVEEAKRVMARTPEGMQFALPTRDFEVVIPSAGLRERFETAREASWYLRGGWAQYEPIKRTLGRKGLPFYIHDGKYVVNTGAETLTAEIGNKKQLQKLLKRVPDPQTLPALLGEEAESMLRDLGLKAPPMGPLVNPSHPPSLASVEKRLASPLALASRVYPTPQTRWIQNQLKATGHSDLLERFDKLGNQSRLFNAEHTKWRRLVEAALSPGGRTISREKRVGIRWYLEATDEATRTKLAETYKLSAADLGVAERVRDIFGRNPNDGLFGLFGIDPNKFLNYYVPHLQDTIETLGRRGSELSTKNIFDAAFPRGVPREMKFFGEMDRLSEVVSYLAEDDIGLLLDRYITQGLKKHYLNPLWRDFDALRVQKLRGATLDPKIDDAILQWRDTLMGYKTDTEKDLEAFSQRLAGKINPKWAKSPLVRDITRVLFTLNTFGTQAWKPWNVIRNMTQVYTVLGSTYGLDETFKAMQTVARDTDNVIARMKNLGVLLDTPPLINSIIDESTLAGKITHKGLAGLKSSDDFTRAAAYVAGENLYNDALAKLQKGVLTSDRQFIDYLKAYRFSEGTQSQLVALTRAGKIEGARDLFGREVVQDTMFSYDKVNQPVLYKGLLGRFIGQYGVYSVQYIQNLRKGLTMGPIADRIAYGTRLLGTMGAFYAVLREMGIQADRDFLPWSPAQFTGGPMFNTILDLYQATGQGYLADEARMRVQRAWSPLKYRIDWDAGQFIYEGPQLPGAATTVVPFASQARTLGEFLKYQQAGQPWLAWLALTNTPIRDDLRQ